MKMTANSTYWEAKVGKDGLADGEGVSGGEKGGNFLFHSPHEPFITR
jgi:hypothetical protein